MARWSDDQSRGQANYRPVSELCTKAYRQPFDMLAVTTSASNEKKVAGGDSDDLRQVWLLSLDSNQEPSG